MNVLFVCTGNTCRSPMAEAFLRDKVVAAGREADFSVASAGLSAAAGEAASPQARLAARRRGASLEAHRARPLSRAAAAQADLILTMTARQKAAILAALPDAAGRTRALSEYAPPGGGDIADPFGSGQDAYDACAAAIAARVENLWSEIKEGGE